MTAHAQLLAADRFYSNIITEHNYSYWERFTCVFPIGWSDSFESGVTAISLCRISKRVCSVKLVTRSQALIAREASQLHGDACGYCLSFAVWFVWVWQFALHIFLDFVLTYFVYTCVVILAEWIPSSPDIVLCFQTKHEFSDINQWF